MSEIAVAKTMAERLEAKVRRDPNGCWYWTGCVVRGGYGLIRTGGRGSPRVLASRASYETFVGPISEGLEPDHLCRHPSCINPAHLELVTHAENIRRSWQHRTQRTWKWKKPKSVSR